MVTNLADLVARTAQQRPDHPALIDGDTAVTYAELDRRVDAAAGWLARHGVHAGDRVGLLLGNGWQFVAALHGALRLGAIAVPLNTSWTDAELAAARQWTGLRVCLADEPRAAAEAVAIDELWRDPTPPPVPARPPADPEATAVLLFTVGSQDRPRAAMLSHRALAANAAAVRQLDEPAAVLPEDRVLAVLPLFHVFSLNAVLTTTLAVGATVVLTRRFEPRATLDLVRRHQVTVVAGAPPMYVAWSGEPDLRPGLASVRLLTSGAAPLPAAVFEQFRTLVGLPIWEGYGLTECAPVVTSSLASGQPRPGSVGAPIPGVELRIVDPGGAVDQESDGDAGEIWVRGASLFSGYWPDGHDGPDPDGWFATGDVGYLDHDGDLRLINRRSDLILVSGFNVYPREVEEVINAHDLVDECAVTSVPHPYTGEAVKAFVVVAAGQRLRPEDVVAWCERRLAKYKCPTIVQIVPAIPHRLTGKIARDQLRHA